MLLTEYISNNAEFYPDKTAFVHQGKKYSFSLVNRLSDVFASEIAGKGLTKGERVVLFLDNCIEYLISYFGILKLGTVVVPLNSQLKTKGIISPLNDCTPKLIITDSRHESTIKESIQDCQFDAELLVVSADYFTDLSGTYTENNTLKADLNEDDLAMIIYTSGTTGKPKGVMLTHANLDANADSIIEYLKLTSEDKIMAILPFYYSYGNSLLTTHMKAGGTIVVDNRFVYPNVILDAMANEEVTGFAGVPSHFIILIKKSAIRKYSFPKLRYVTQAGGAMPPAMIKEFRTILPDVDFFVMYGQTEASARLSYLEPNMLNEKMGSIGKALPGVELNVLNENGEKAGPGETGEIVARGRNITKGYWNDSEESANVLKKKGLYTGDLAKVDEDGFLYIVSRKKEMIKSGANRISPYSIEDIVCQMEGIIECAAVGVPDEILGEVIKLYVVVGESGKTENDIKIFCKDNMASYMVPKYVAIIQELPKTFTGKIKRVELAKV